MRRVKGLLFGFKTMDFIKRYLPILSELFESDTVIIFAIGAGLGFLFGFLFKDIRHRNRAAISCLAAYALCEIILDIRVNMGLGLLLLIVGTTALGACMGILLNFPVYMLLAKKKT